MKKTSTRRQPGDPFSCKKPGESRDIGARCEYPNDERNASMPASES